MHRALMGIILLFAAVQAGAGDTAGVGGLPAAELGERVLAIEAALRAPRAPGAMQAVTALGHDQRYYAMVRGWLGYRLAADLSVRDARRGQVPSAWSDRIAFLERAIRRLDLE